MPEIPSTGSIELTVFNQIGQAVSILSEGQFRQGKHQVSFDASGLPPGIYFLRLQAGEGVVTRKIVKL